MNNQYYQCFKGEKMIRTNDHSQLLLFDPWDYLSPKRRAILDQSWSGLFRNEILRQLPIKELKPSFSKTMGRPTKELYTMLGALVLQQAHDLTDEGTVAQLAFNIQWHYALNIIDESDDAKYMSLKTLWNFRKLVIEKQLDTIIFDKIASKLAECFNVNTDKQRIDSVHIKSNMRRLGRISIFSSGIHKFLVNLKRKYPELFKEIDTQLVEKYFSDKSLTCFSMVKPSDSHRTLKDVSSNLFDLAEQFKGDTVVSALYSYKLLNRILAEHCNLKETGEGKKIEIKKPKEIPADSLQNPSDPDATYSGHKGQGYQVQIMETYTDTDDMDQKEETLNLITHVKVERASDSDAHALMPAIESVEKRNLSPKEVLADSLYGSDDNCEAAKSKDIDLVSPTMGTIKADELTLSDFQISDNGQVEKCPQGYSPTFTKNKKDRITQGFNIDTCAICPAVKGCPVKKGKNFYYLRYTRKSARLAKRRSIEQSDQFKDRYRWRAGVEATMSEYDKRTGVKRLRVRGFGAVRFAATLKAAAINIFRAAAVRNEAVYA